MRFLFFIITGIHHCTTVLHAGNAVLHDTCECRKNRRCKFKPPAILNLSVLYLRYEPDQVTHAC